MRNAPGVLINAKFLRGFAADPAEGAHDATQDPTPSSPSATRYSAPRHLTPSYFLTIQTLTL